MYKRDMIVETDTKAAKIALLLSYIYCVNPDNPKPELNSKILDDYTLLGYINRSISISKNKNLKLEKMTYFGALLQSNTDKHEFVMPLEVL